MNKRLWILLSTIFLGRVLIVFFLQVHPTFFLGIRNFNGRGLLLQPTYLDFVLPLLLLVFLLPERIGAFRSTRASWQPAYNHARQAEKIEQLNLSGKAVVWSHYYEYGGFQLWYRLAQDLGTRELFRKRWEYTRRDLPGMAFLENNPDAARTLAEAFGKEKFLRYGTVPSRKFGEIYREADWLSLASLSGMPQERIKRLYRLKADQMVEASITIP